VGKKKSRHAREAAAEAAVFSDYPLSGDSEELHALLSGWINVGSMDGLPGVDESSALAIPAFSRGVGLIAGTIAGLPLKTYIGEGANRREVPSIFDDPTGPYEISPFNWVDMIVRHLVMYEEANLIELRNGAGALVGYYPVHPVNVSRVEWAGPAKRFHVTDANGGSTVYGTPSDPTDAGAILQILGPTCSGLRGTSLFRQHRRIFQIAQAAEKASARTFTGALIGGLVTTDGDEDIEGDEAQLIVEKLNQKVSGTENAGRLAFINRHLKLTNWQMSNLDAQFSESRAFQIEEFARMLGLMPIHLAQTEKQTSWGTGISEQNLGLARFTLMQYTSRIESAINVKSNALPFSDFIEFDYKGLLQGTPKEEIALLLEQVAGGLLEVNEARAILNLPPTAIVPAPQGVTTNG